MKFVAGSWHAKDVPFHLETEAMVCKELTVPEYFEKRDSRWIPPLPVRQPSDRQARYVLRWWNWGDGTKTYFMALANEPDTVIDSWARPLFRSLRASGKA